MDARKEAATEVRSEENGSTETFGYPERRRLVTLFSDTREAARRRPAAHIAIADTAMPGARAHRPA